MRTTERAGVRGWVAGHRRAAAGIVLAGVAALVAGIVWFQPHKLFIDQRVSEDLPPSGTSGEVEVGAGNDFLGIDHYAAGGANLVTADGRTFVRFDEDFEVSNGPDLVVWLTAVAPEADPARFADDFVSLGQLKGNIGAQNYEIAAGVDLERYPTVVVWCRRFNVAFAAARVTA